MATTIESGYYTEKGSKFFGFTYNVDSVEAFCKELELLKKEHKHAGHFCYAYTINEVTAPLIGGTTLREKYSNDGEPSGVGLALMNLLKQTQRHNTAVIVVRYWGGILLGAGNLIRAYRTAAKNAVSV